MSQRDWEHAEMRRFAEQLPEDLGPCFGRDVCLVLDELNETTRERDIERAHRRWAFQQLRDWWRGVARDMSDPRIPIGELDRIERRLDE